MATLYGTPGKDVVYALDEGYHTVHGLGGDDELHTVRRPDDAGEWDSVVELYGGDGDDLLEGSGVIHVTAEGGAGHDRFDLRAESVRVVGGAGDDRVRTFSTDADVYGGDGDDLLDVVTGYNGVRIDAGAGSDTVLVGGSDDGGRAQVRGGAGDDTISAHPEPVFGGLAAHIDANGGAGRDVITGSDNPDTVSGFPDYGAGDDLLYGGSGNDRISGRRGDDKLGGDGGVDTLTGGAGRDVFDFNQGGSGVGAGKRDVVADFAPGQDTLDLLSIDANAGRAGDQAFAFVGTRAFTGAGQVRLAKVDGDTVVQGSTDGDAQPEFEVLLPNGATPAAGDFLLPVYPIDVRYGLW